MPQKQRSFFKKLSRLFRYGSQHNRGKNARGYDTEIAQQRRGTISVVQKSQSPSFANMTGNAYNLTERLMRYQDFCEMEYCVAESTLIAQPDGYKTIGELARECELEPDKTFIVYSYDHEKRCIVPAIGKQARQTRTDDAWRVKFDNGQEIVGTADHRLMLRDGTFCKIGELKPGMAMMPFHRRDLYAGKEDAITGYRWVYTMAPGSHNGWEAEHRMIAEWVADRHIADDEVVHHINFKKDDNRPENLVIMTRSDHSAYHATLNNEKKWSNVEWVEQFKARHSAWMCQNNPATRHDITFGRILETCERVGFNVKKLTDTLDIDLNVVKRRLRAHGFKDFQTFARAYCPGWKNGGQDNRGDKNPRYDASLTFERICSAYEPGMTLDEMCSALNTTPSKIQARIRTAGKKSFAQFAKNYANHKVVSVEHVGIIPLYDLTVDGYKNFATDSVISHNTPELASALDIYADESVAGDEKDRVFHIFSTNEAIKEALEDLFYNVLNVEFNLRGWVRNLVKYGDLFLLNELNPDNGIVRVVPLPVNEIEREEGYDPEDPTLYRFRWVTLGNRELDCWQVTHMRLLGNDQFLPYGMSVIESARRIWRQLILIEDAMLTYRIVRAPERRVFYIDVGNTPPEEVPLLVEDAKRNIRSAPVVDRMTGRTDLRYNPVSIEEDFWIPVRGTETGTKIETLQGGQNAAAVEDVQYIQRKLFAAIKIPKAYLGYDDLLSSKATLAQEDIRFSRTIAVIQKTVIAEMNRLAIMHLYCLGFPEQELQDFSLRLSNPSTVAQQQKLELLRAKAEIAGSFPDGMVDKEWIRKEVIGFTDEHIARIDERRLAERIMDAKIEAAGEPTEEGGGGGGGGGGSLFGGSGEAPGGDLGDAGDDLGATAAGESPPAGDAGEPEPAGEPEADVNAADDADDELDAPDVTLLTSADDPDEPTARDRAERRAKRKRHHGAAAIVEPDFSAMLSRSVTDDPFDSHWLRQAGKNPLAEEQQVYRTSLPADLAIMLRRLPRRNSRLLS